MAEVFLEVLTPTARYLGKLWETDHCDFVEVTVGLRRLQEILWRLSPEDEAAGARIEEAPRALFLPTPGESHVFGVAMVETFFRAAGWRVKRGGHDFADELAREWFDLVGFSLSGDRHLEVLANAMAKRGRRRAIRRCSCWSAGRFSWTARRWSCASGPTAPPPTRPALFNWRAVCYGGAPRVNPQERRMCQRPWPDSQ